MIEMSDTKRILILPFIMLLLTLECRPEVGVTTNEELSSEQITSPSLALPSTQSISPPTTLLPSDSIPTTSTTISQESNIPEATIKKVDTETTPIVYLLPRQIAIEAMVVEVGENFTREVGIRYGYNRSEIRAPSNSIKGMDLNFAASPDPVSVMQFRDSDSGYAVERTNRTPGLGLQLGKISISTGEFNAILRAHIRTGDAEIRSQPIAIALEDSETHIQTVDEIPFQDVRFIGARLTPYLDVSFEKVGVTLTVTPSLAGPNRNFVRLKINQLEVSQVSSYITVRHVSRPVVAISSARSEVLLNDRETLVLGGLKSERERQTKISVPIIGKIPYIGALFSYKKHIREKTDIYFFITPTILFCGENPAFPKDFIHTNLKSDQFKQDKFF